MNNVIRRIVLFLFLFSFLIGAGSPVPAEAAQKPGACSLRLTATPSSTSIPLGGELTYSYSLKNVGLGTCFGAGVSLYYAENEEYVSSNPSPSASDYYWSIGNLKRGKTFVFSVNMKNVFGGEQMLGEACAAANNTGDACVSTPVNLSASSSTATNIQAWIYPGQPACNAANEYSDGRQIDTLKPEYYTVQSTGALRQLTASADGCNGYSADNAADIKAHSSKQFVTVSGSIANVRKLLSSTTLRSAAIGTLTDFTVATGFTGVELDWEGFGDWTATDYANYKNFVAALQTSLHAQGKFLMIDAPAISDAQYQSYFLFKYEDFADIDYVAIMAYDYQYDYGVGQPVAPQDWVEDIINWAKARLETDKIIIGIANYGYHGQVGSYNISIDTYAQSSAYSGFSSRELNAEGEEVWTSGTTYYAVQSVSALDNRKAFIESLGIKSVSVWHLGDNPWFSNDN